MKRKSRCTIVFLHLLINWLTYNVALFVVLWNTCSSFDRTEWAAIIAMAMITGGLNAMQYDIWKAKHQQDNTEFKTRVTDP